MYTKTFQIFKVCNTYILLRLTSFILYTATVEYTGNKDSNDYNIPFDNEFGKYKTFNHFA